MRQTLGQVIKVGDKVWALREPPDYYSSDPAKAFPPEVWVRGIVEGIGALWGTNPCYRVRIAGGEIVERRQWSGSPSPIKPYEIVDKLADLIRCGACVDYGMDRCPEHAGLIVIEAGPAAGPAAGNGCVTWIDGTTTASTDPGDAISQLGALSLQGVRRPLPAGERARRRASSKRSRASRHRNR